MKKKSRRMLAWLLVCCMSMGMIFLPPATAHAATQMVPIQVTYGQSEARKMLARINSFRTDADQAWAYDSSNNRESYSGLGTLQYDYGLEQIAMKRAAEIALSFDHTRPNGQDCFTAYTFDGGNIGENIAAGSSSRFSSEENVFNAWKEEDKNYDGQGHRRNMLGRQFKAVGIGHVTYDGIDYWVQEFSLYGSGKSQTQADNSTSVVEIDTDDSYIQDMKATAATLSVKKGETIALSDLQVMLLVKEHFGNGGYCRTTADYTANVADNTIAIYQNNKLTGVKAGKTFLMISAFGKRCNVEVTVTDTDSESGKEEPKPGGGNQGTETGKEEENKPLTLVKQPQNVHGVIGSKVAFQVQAEGTGLVYQWRYSNDGQISDQEYSYFPKSSENSLSLMVTKKNASVTYWCHITDRYGNSVNTEPCKIQCDIQEGYVANGICGNQICWSLDSAGLMTIEGSGSINPEDIPWGDYADAVKSVVMKGNISKIGAQAFANMTSLRNVKFPASLSMIDEEAFYGTGLSYFELPDGVREIGDCAFAYISGGSNGNKKISLSKNLTKIGNMAFYRSELPILYVPSSVREIGQEAFAYVKLLQCESGSFAETYAKNNQLKYEIVKNGTNSSQGQLPGNNSGSGSGSGSGGGSGSGFGGGSGSGSGFGGGNSVAPVVPQTPVPTHTPEPGQKPVSSPTPEPAPTPADNPMPVTEPVQGTETQEDSKEKDKLVTQKEKGVTTEARISGKTTTVTLASAKKKVEVPQTVTDEDGKKYKVTKLGAKAFSECSRVKQIALPAGIVSVDRKAFSGITTKDKTILLDASLSKKEVRKIQKKLRKAGFKGIIKQAEKNPERKMIGG